MRGRELNLDDVETLTRTDSQRLGRVAKTDGHMCMCERGVWVRQVCVPAMSMLSSIRTSFYTPCWYFIFLIQNLVQNQGADIHN
jgi:hypothetical protein